MRNLLRFSELILEMLYSFFLAGSFQFSFRRIPSAHFV